MFTSVLTSVTRCCYVAGLYIKRRGGLDVAQSASESQSELRQKFEQVCDVDCFRELEPHTLTFAHML